jgi:peroxiredoxin
MNKSSLAERLRECSEAEALTRIKAMAEPLSIRLAHYVEWLASSSPDFASAYQAFVQRLSTAEFGSRGPHVGEQFPSFMLPDQDGHLVSLAKVLSERPLVLSFNRGHWCSLCQIELDALNKAAPEIEAAGGSVVAIIPEPQVLSRKLRAENNLDLVVLSDMDLSFAASLDLVVYMGEDLRALYLANGIDVGACQLTDGWFLPVPATFVIGTGGQVVARYVDPDFRRRMEVEDILQALASVRSSGSNALE